jgi:hypothetical protein
MNRRRMSGHRVVPAAGGPATSIRAPWAVYENADESSNGQSETGNGPDLTGYNWGDTPGIVGDAIYGGAGPSVPETSAGLNLAADFSVGFWREIKSTSDDSVNAVGSYVGIYETVEALTFTLANFAVADVFRLSAFSAQSAGFADLEDLPIGMHHFGMSVTGGAVKFFHNGVQVGTGTYTPNGGSSPNFTFENGESSDGGYMAQIVLAQVGYTAEEWAYIYNSGAGRAFDDWEIKP